jgi:lysophospholipase
MTSPDPFAAPAAVPAGLAATYRPADRWAFFDVGDARLRYGWWNASGPPRGTVLVLQGRAEFIEKYAIEVVGELVQRGFAVAALDWRGQGLSDRPLPDHDKGHIDGFGTYISDLRRFVDAVIAPAAPRPLIALCHSMGSHIFLRALAAHGPAPFAGAVTVAPMTGLKREGLLRGVLRLVPPLPVFDTRYLLGTGPYTAAQQIFHGNVLTHDHRRFGFTRQWFDADPRLALGGPTFGWCRQAVRSMTEGLMPGALERIDLPVLVVSGGQDDLVDSATHGPVAARLPKGALASIPASRHEVLMETDAVRAAFWQAFDRLAKGLCV